MDRLTGIPRVTLFKETRSNYLVARIVLLEDLVHYRSPFRIPDLLEENFRTFVANIIPEIQKYFYIQIFKS